VLSALRRWLPHGHVLYADEHRSSILHNRTLGYMFHPPGQAFKSKAGEVVLPRVHGIYHYAHGEEHHTVHRDKNAAVNIARNWVRALRASE